MERDRDNEVWIVICRGSPYSFKGKKRKWIAQVDVPVIFESVDQLAQGAFIEKVCPGGVKMWRMESACTAAVVAAGSGKRNAAEGTKRR